MPTETRPRCRHLATLAVSILWWFGVGCPPPVEQGQRACRELVDDDGDGAFVVGDEEVFIGRCPDGWITCLLPYPYDRCLDAPDCDDLNPDAFPGAEEACGEPDLNCDGGTTECPDD